MKKTVFSLALLFSVINSSSAFSHSSLLEIGCTILPIDSKKIHQTGTTYSLDNVSENWSGYASAMNFTGTSANGTVSNVSGGWIVPTLLPSSTTASCAIWVGIDGYLSNSVEQIGTSHSWTRSGQQNYAWFEMYPNGSYQIGGFPVDSGDQISAEVNYLGGDTFLLTIANHTQGVMTTIPTSYTMSSTAKRSSAEWIVEAPYSGTILPLADFQLAQFNHCSTTINNVIGGISNPNWQTSEITMESSMGHIESRPSSLTNNGSSFEVIWIK